MGSPGQVLAAGDSQGDAGLARPCPAIGRGKEALFVAALLLYAAVLWVWGVGRRDITHGMEASRAAGAQSMLHSGDYLIPRMGARYNLVKPPLFHWSVAAVSRLTGRVTATTARLPSALAALGILVVLYFGTRPVLGWKTAYAAAAAAATMPMAFGPATEGDVNMLLALGVAVAMFAAFHMLEAGKLAWLFAIACGLGLAMTVMTKWQMGLLFFVPTLTLYMGLQREGDALARRRWRAAYLAAAALLLWLAMAASSSVGGASSALYLAPVGMLIYFGARGHSGRRWVLLWATAASTTVLLALIWPVLAAQRVTLHTLLATIRQECVNLRTQEITELNHEPIWYYLAAVPLATLPFSLLAPLAFCRGYASGASPRERRLILLAACWLVGSLLLFTLCSPARKVRYVLPVFPAVALLAADVLVRGMGGRLVPWMNRAVRSVGALIVWLVCLAPLALLATWFAAKIPFSGWAVAMALVAAAAAVAGIYLHRVRHSGWAALAAVALVILATKILVQFGYPHVLNPRSSPRAACQHIRDLVPPGEKLYVDGEEHGAVIFYLDPEPRPAADALRERGEAIVCIVGSWKNTSWLPPGSQGAELGRAAWPGGELRLLRITLRTSSIPHLLFGPDGIYSELLGTKELGRHGQSRVPRTL